MKKGEKVERWRREVYYLVYQRWPFRAEVPIAAIDGSRQRFQAVQASIGRRYDGGSCYTRACALRAGQGETSPPRFCRAMFLA